MTFYTTQTALSSILYDSATQKAVPSHMKCSTRGKTLPRECLSLTLHPATDVVVVGGCGVRVRVASAESEGPE
ncbi:hypothetical protein DAPPUDRAFT_267412 [Daphnia pulex]|uniref:Uncharacterized protein n=1 Tax=Daphnia pulex TaxID=6669 RepID=E9HWF7_DAPPU|nr:hypothetical protein DAPPUDRAFT_267412 [Daphnia pulex]|eukprot:EFX63923.1 hypothetical protein DAPPUDRAFT_267412 [Daphnia pulex]